MKRYIVNKIEGGYIEVSVERGHVNAVRVEVLPEGAELAVSQQYCKYGVHDNSILLLSNVVSEYSPAHRQFFKRQYCLVYCQCGNIMWQETAVLSDEKAAQFREFCRVREERSVPSDFSEKNGGIGF